ncbi:endonuclease/exonuclease/phosphatase family protein [Ornithinicoccus hortensis]|uniref:Endonuclease/exonuclease/phosphatase family protein n=1 Tax=Ornithinicoccus hortensis TaxID=82346 RepID=A0A542YPB3_9MICO|nr:endonuclease/exonuclease/phosphatase family protein [Ornithinicoccus hortensis]TQL49764.1 endonuclease/exonuclease/phosphatase family protein [Ornithinicoccus hortensis]
MRLPTRPARRLLVGAVAATLLSGLTLTSVATAGSPSPTDRPDPHAAKEVGRPDMDVRFATFNASLNRAEEGQLLADLSTPDNAQARAVAEIIQRTDPDVLLVNEFDFVEGGAAAELFRSNYLEVPQQGAEPVDYPYYYVAPSNTGVPSGYDLNNDGVVGGPDDAFGFGEFEGQYGMVVYSKFPIDVEAVRTFQLFKWADMPGNLIPTDFYSPEEQAVLRLSSKSHWDLPISVGNTTVHFLVSHPTPPTFDGPEDRNGRRNHDEIRFWADYVTPGATADYIYDDQGGTGGLPARAAFVIAGDQNADPLDGDSYDGAISALLDHPRINTRSTPSSAGGVEASELQGGINLEHLGDPGHDTADFAEPPGNIRADYVLPSSRLRILDSGVFWPTSDDPLSRLTGTYPFPSSDHRLVWVDLKLPHRQ